MNSDSQQTNEMPLNIKAFSALPCCLMKDDPAFEQPTPSQVKQLRKHLELSQSGLARLTGVPYTPKGSNTVRKWETNAESSNYKPIPYSVWRLMLVAANIIGANDDLLDIKGVQTKY